MPLRDHFRPPLDERHSWDELHGMWPAMLVLQLSRLLPPEYYAAPQIHLSGSIAFDVAAFDQSGNGAAHSGAAGDGGVAAAVWTGAQPTLRVETELPDADEYEVRVYDVRRERRLVAAIELVSPSNKDRPESREAFVSNCAALLKRNVFVTMIDVVTTRDFNLYAALAALESRADAPFSDPPGNIYAAACRSRTHGKQRVFEAWHVPLAIGQPLPELPLWLADDLAVTVDFEASYEESCRAVRIG
jgi:hypothetical protein